jgi:2-keto-4-pentenoate hydratase/2-oxohepta-3-ene-1,7-dioic acid hydratase in catechol pathway
VLTGTPSGVGAFREPPVFLAAGDRVEVEVEGVGTLSNPVRGPV